MWFLWLIPCALANRIRGGWLGDSIRQKFPFWATTPARIFFALIVSAPLLTVLPLYKFFLFANLFFVGLIFKWAPWQNMETPEKDVFSLALRGLILTAPCGLTNRFYFFALSGAFMGVCYWLGHICPFHYQQRDGYVWNGSDWGEVIFGAWLGFCVGLTIYYGRF